MFLEGKSSELTAMLFATERIAKDCEAFIQSQAGDGVVDLQITPMDFAPPDHLGQQTIWAVIVPKSHYSFAKAYWQHTGLGISSRLAEYCLDTLNPASSSPKKPYRHRHYSKDIPQLVLTEEVVSRDQVTYLEERYGRNLDVVFAQNAKRALKRRIAGVLNENVDVNKGIEKCIQPDVSYARNVKALSEEHVFLFPTGMSSIYFAHRVARHVMKNAQTSVCYGFTYVDTLKILQKWGRGCLFYGHTSEAELDAFEETLASGRAHIQALFCEFPSNPLLKSPNLRRIRQLADHYHFLVVVDETIGNFINVDVLQYADMLVSSLTKIFSGDSNVMGGSMVVNPHSPFRVEIMEAIKNLYEDVLWAEDAIFLERNSRTFVERTAQVNANAEAVANLLLSCNKVKKVYYPKFDKINYDACKTKDGGYGGLLSFVCHDIAQAQRFHDTIVSAKGPSLGTNFTITSPYTILAHYTELDWVSICTKHVTIAH